MLEIIALVFLTTEIGRIAHNKGRRPATWKFYTVAGWIVSEIIGVVAGFMIFGMNNFFSVGLVGLTFAITSYFIIKAQLNKLPDYFDDEINSIGNN